MAEPKSSKWIYQIGFIVLLLFVAIFHFFVTFVVVLFVLSTLNIINNRLLHIEHFNNVEIVITSVIFIISAGVFLKSFKRISEFIKKNIFRDTRFL
jgi:uncharacterized membrane protein